MAFIRPWLVVTLSFFLLYMAWRHQADLGVASSAKKLLDVIRIVKRATGDKPKQFHRHIVAVGDLHGDAESARRVLEFSGVANSKGDWSGKLDFFVQTGDIVDRGDDTIKLFRWMNALRIQATRVGGTVLLHLGNHEWMNAIGIWNFVPASEIKTFGSREAREEVISTGWIGKSWKEHYTIASRLPLHPAAGQPNEPYLGTRKPLALDKRGCEKGPFAYAAISFVHGGLPPEYPQLVPFPTLMNELGSSMLSKVQASNMTALNRRSPANATKEEIGVYINPKGPVWYDGWATKAEEVVCKEVDKVLHMTGTRRMVMGHTPNRQKIVSRCGGKIIIIDTGISKAYGGVLSALDIKYSVTPVFGNDGRLEKWQEKEVIKAVYEEPRPPDVITDETWEVLSGDGHELTSITPHQQSLIRCRVNANTVAAPLAAH